MLISLCHPVTRGSRVTALQIDPKINQPHTSHRDVTRKSGVTRVTRLLVTK
jgi:hypothetical protein